jgi:carboxyl-terminal processing protease
MKIAGWFLAIGCISPWLFMAQTAKVVPTCQLIGSIQRLIADQHYSPKPIDDSLSVYINREFLNELDTEHRLFLQSEVDELSRQALKIDDEIKQNNCTFLDNYRTAYRKAISRFTEVVQQLKKEAIPFETKGSIAFSNGHDPYPANVLTIKERLKNRIQFNTLRHTAELSPKWDSIKALLPDLLPKMRKKTLDSYDCFLSDLALSDTEFDQRFLDLFCGYFDPHSAYFSTEGKSSFYAMLSAENQSFGLVVQLNDQGELMVADVVPGSAAYKTHKIAPSDQIVAIKHHNQTFTLGCHDLAKIEEIFTNSSIQEAQFSFRKKDGSVFEETLQKMLLKDYENTVYSLVLIHEKTKVGYLNIPSFYGQFENGNSSVAEDVAKALIVLEDEGISGLIIDLQNNGGGSLEEAVKLTGLFLPGGPVAIMHQRNGKRETLKDPQRGMAYSGPVGVLINGNSASASEFFCNALQDYNRAVVIGSPSFGKATMQQVLPLENAEGHFLKITLQQFYRITGQSNQYEGVIPDLNVPSLFDFKMPREKEYDTALKNKPIEAHLTYMPLKWDQKSSWITLQQQRINQESQTKDITQLNTELAAIYDQKTTQFALNMTEVFKRVHQYNALWKRAKEMNDKKWPYQIALTKNDQNTSNIDEFLKSTREHHVHNIQTDYSIWEAFLIMQSLKNKAP